MSEILGRTSRFSCSTQARRAVVLAWLASAAAGFVACSAATAERRTDADAPRSGPELVLPPGMTPQTLPTDTPTTRTETRLTMGTLVRITAATTNEIEAAEAFSAAFDAIERVVDVASEWEPDSDISRVNQNAGGPALQVDPMLIEILSVAAQVSEASGGKFDVTWAPLRHIWTFDECAGPPDPEAVAQAVLHIDWTTVQLDLSASTVQIPAGTELGLGGIAKGYAVAEAARAMRARGVVDFVIDAGGDVFAAGTNHGQPWRVVVRDPTSRDGGVAEKELRDGSLVTSGNYEHFCEYDGKRAHHLLDPDTGYSAQGLSSVSVLAEDPTVADALATAAFVLGADAGLQLLEDWPGAEGLLLADDGTVRTTSGW